MFSIQKVSKCTVKMLLATKIHIQKLIIFRCFFHTYVYPPLNKKYTCVDHSIDVQIFTPVPGFRKGTMESYTFIVFSKFLYFHGLVDQHSVGRKTSIL